MAGVYTPPSIHTQEFHCIHRSFQGYTVKPHFKKIFAYVQTAKIAMLKLPILHNLLFLVAEYVK